MQFSYYNYLVSALSLSLYLSIILLNNKISALEISTNLSVNEKPIQIQVNESKEEEDLLILSSWKTLKYWTSNSSLHSSKIVDNFEDIFHSNDSVIRKISGIDFYRNQTNCQNVLIWCELMSQTIYRSVFYIKNQNFIFKESAKLLKMNFGSHIRLAVDSNHKNIYLSLFNSSRIDVFDIENKVLKPFLTNISHPVDIAIDSKRQVLYWIENWTCISKMFLNNNSVVKMCSINARSLAVDSENGYLFWSDSNGNLFQQKYFERSAQKVFTVRKMKQNFALGVTSGAIYLSDLFKLTAINRSTLNEKVVLIESPAILDFISIEKKYLCEAPVETSFDKIISNKTIEKMTPNVIPMDESLTSYSKNITNNPNDLFSSQKWYLIVIILFVIIFISFSLIFMSFLKYYKKNKSKRTRIKRISGRNTNKFIFNDKNRLLNAVQNVGKTVCIEDLGSFSNNGYLDPQTFCNNCPIRQTCSSCDDREECEERGICLTTYKLLT